jgi:hypothetical protein
VTHSTAHSKLAHHGSKLALKLLAKLLREFWQAFW